jgi:hypothetical protein
MRCVAQAARAVAYLLTQRAHAHVRASGGLRCIGGGALGRREPLLVATELLGEPVHAHVRRAVLVLHLFVRRQVVGL